MLQMVGKVMMGGCQGVSMLFVGCCELLPGYMQLISCSGCF